MVEQKVSKNLFEKFHETKSRHVKDFEWSKLGRPKCNDTEYMFFLKILTNLQREVVCKFWKGIKCTTELNTLLSKSFSTQIWYEKYYFDWSCIRQSSKLNIVVIK